MKSGLTAWEIGEKLDKEFPDREEMFLGYILLEVFRGKDVAERFRRE